MMVGMLMPMLLRIIMAMVQDDDDDYRTVVMTVVDVDYDEG